MVVALPQNVQIKIFSRFVNNILVVSPFKCEFSVPNRPLTPEFMVSKSEIVSNMFWKVMESVHSTLGQCKPSHQIWLAKWMQSQENIDLDSFYGTLIKAYEILLEIRNRKERGDGEVVKDGGEHFTSLCEQVLKWTVNKGEYAGAMNWFKCLCNIKKSPKSWF